MMGIDGSYKNPKSPAKDTPTRTIFDRSVEDRRELLDRMRREHAKEALAKRRKADAGSGFSDWKWMSPLGSKVMHLWPPHASKFLERYVAPLCGRVAVEPLEIDSGSAISRCKSCMLAVSSHLQE